MAALCGDGMIADLADRYLNHPKVTGKWKRWAPIRLKSTYERGGSPIGCSSVEPIAEGNADRGEVNGVGILTTPGT